MKTLFIILISAGICGAQDYSAFTNTTKKLLHASDMEQASIAWGEFIEKEAVPFVVHDSVAFLYKGDAKSVMWMGDFNQWGNNKDFNNKGTRIKGTDLWILKASFPADARLDYKIVIDESTWILDP